MSNLKTLVAQFLDDQDYSSDMKSDSFFHSGFSIEETRWNNDSDESIAQRAFLTEHGITVTHVNNYGGEEMGRDYWSVYSFTKDSETVYVQFDGWYESYNGSEFEEWFFVEPKPVQKIEFVKVK